MTNPPQNWLNWIESRNRNFSDPTGFLSITSLVWLSAEPQEILGLSGSWWSDGETVFVKESNTGDHSWFIGMEDKTIDFDDIKVELAFRNNQLVVRPRDPRSEMLQAFEGVLTFDYDAKFSVIASFEPFPFAKEVVVGSVVEGMTTLYVSPGVLLFQIDGVEYKLTAFEKAGSKNLVIYFKDETSNVFTYGTGRSVTANYQEDGSYILDFPCSYTDFATCPVAPHENRLSVAIEAGEKKPLYRNTVEGVVSQVH
ncbi:MAG: DUF1684 domain-containing protein [Micrococcales bacterium]|nr:DUF1684 domain-containing protein [Micrococcales bacterium]